MLIRMRTALKFLTWGLVLGILFAPRSGAETRKELGHWISTSARGMLSGGDREMRAEP